MVPGGTLNPSGTSAPAPTSAPSPTTARLRVTDPDPIMHRSPTTQPSRWVLWPTTHSVPMTVGQSCVVWTTVPSWIEVRAPTSMLPWSPRSTAHGQTDASAPRRTFPMITASGWTKAAGSISGSTFPSA